MPAADQRWMRVALGLAQRGLGTVWPNPAVGCVLLRDGILVGQGWTKPGGRPHAETEALAMAGPLAAGATAYVTLEPCAHHGKTPPCAEALVAAKVARVVCALEDPDGRVAGKGFEILRDAGIEVPEGVLSDEARKLNLGFLLNRTIGRPMVTLKLAGTLDGRIATESGESRWITGPESRRYVHHLRANHDAILIGVGTARADDPMLDVRDIGLPDRAPVRVVADGGLSLSLTSRLVQTAADRPLWVCHRAAAPSERAEALESAGVRLIAVNQRDGGELDLPDMLQKLSANGLTRVFCEGGGSLAASLVKDDLVDRLILFQAGKLIGAEGAPLFGRMGLDQLESAPQFTLDAQRRFGADSCTFWSR